MSVLARLLRPPVLLHLPRTRLFSHAPPLHATPLPSTHQAPPQQPTKIPLRLSAQEEDAMVERIAASILARVDAQLAEWDAATKIKLKSIEEQIRWLEQEGYLRDGFSL
ncbi:hypothetical protein BJ508DRAFT_380769 [Ascobolus immersus RN42]|uniref:Uncharacterized protein n=1 Tax=Ascobolus immersus RN42 TaxID=1160509 RepID=A0A3N4HMD3_ASCIM|nr:hypothetical protein BJ508DRAFT_380769 [Ascobolus immersus RN42]